MMNSNFFEFKIRKLNEEKLIKSLVVSMIKDFVFDLVLINLMIT